MAEPFDPAALSEGAPLGAFELELLPDVDPSPESVPLPVLGEDVDPAPASVEGAFGEPVVLPPVGVVMAPSAAEEPPPALPSP